MDNFLSLFTNTIINICKRFSIALLILILGHWLVKVITKKIQKLKIVQKLDAAARIYLKNAVSVILNLVVVLSAIGYMGVPMASVTAALSSAGLALGLALQGGLSNIAGGMILLFTHPFRIGDYVIIGDLDGTVEAIGIYYTEIITPNNQKILIPNGTAANSEITNFSAKDTRRSCLEFSIAYNADIEKAKNILLETAATNELALKSPQAEIFVSRHDESSVVLTLQLWTKNENFKILNSQILQSVKQKFDAEKIEIPYPQMDIHIKQ